MSDNEDDVLPFNLVSTELYEPGESQRPVNSPSESRPASTGVSTVRKRRINNSEENWQRNIRKRLRCEGKSYLSAGGKVVPPRTTGADCKCRYKCFIEVDDDAKQRLLDDFNKLGSKHAQDLYLAGLVTAKSVVRTRPKTGERTPRAVTNTYRVQVGPQDCKRVCKHAFAALHGVSCKRVEIIIKKLSQETPVTTPEVVKKQTKPTPKRVKQTSPTVQQSPANKSNVVSKSNGPGMGPQQLLRLVHEHIESFPTRRSQHRGSNRKYLPAQLSVKVMHQLFLKKDPAHSAVPYELFNKYFQSNFSIHFGSPRTDVCRTCDGIAKELSSADVCDERRQELELNRNLHQFRADSFYADVKSKTALAAQNQDTEVLCFDYQQNLPLPKVSSGDAFYKRQCWVYNFAISSGKSQRHQFYLYDETVGRKTCNEPISFLHHYINNVLSPDIKTLYLFSDNCVSQNKNHTLTQYLFSLVKSGRLNQIVHRFPEPSHSSMPCDQAFGLIEKKLQKIDRVFVPSEYAKIIQRTSKKFTVTEVGQEMIFDFAEFLRPFYLKTSRLSGGGSKDRKYCISRCKVFVYETEFVQQGVMKVSESVDGPAMQEVKMVDIRKSSSAISLDNLLRLAYHTSLPLKAAKWRDVMELAKMYVANNDMWFYDQLKQDGAALDEPEESEGEFDG